MNTNEILIYIYNKLLESERETKNLKININYLNSNVDLESSYYLPLKIKNWIEANIKYTFTISYKYNKKNIVIKFYSDVLNLINNFDIYRTILIINFLINFSKQKCSKNMNINIYLTPFKKYFEQNLTPDNINTGFSTYGCRINSYLTIFRYEEWLKVLIHELIHNLDLDFSTENIRQFESKMYKVFKFNCKYQFYETYCEIWARLLNICICSLFEIKENLTKKNVSKKNVSKKNVNLNNFNKFKYSFNKKIIEEQNFSLLQSKFMLNYLYSNKKKFIDNNIFSYYVLTSLLLINYKEFLDFCHKNNNNILQFNKNEKNIYLFLELILNNYNKYLKLVNIDNIHSLNIDNDNYSLRMSIIE